MPDGSVRIVHEKARVDFDDAGKPGKMIGTVHDITGVKKTEVELRALSRSLVHIQEEERRSIARELHDQIGQSLTVLSLQLGRAARATEKDDYVSRLSEAQASVCALMDQVRNLSLDLRPGMLDDLGLLPALLWYFDRFTAQTKIEISFKKSRLGRKFSPEVRTAAYRIIQEALTNVVRHAKVGKVAVCVWVEKDRLLIDIEDKGVGFNISMIPLGLSGGLYGMYERAKSLGGELVIESRPGAGTIIRSSLPIPSHKKRRVMND
jgi:signal transduction histidine kinase